MKTYRIDMSATYLFSVEVDAESLEDAKDMALEHATPDPEVDVDFLGQTENFDYVRIADVYGDFNAGQGEAEINDTKVEKAQRVE